MLKPFFLSLLLSTLCLTQASAQYARQVVLITIDGFRLGFYLDPSWGAVNLQQLKATGTYTGELLRPSRGGSHGYFPGFLRYKQGSSLREQG